MKITSNDRYLAIVLKSLTDTIEPELQSGNAQASLGMIKGVLAELLKREHVTGALLREQIRQGLDLQDALSDTLRLQAVSGAAGREHSEALLARDDLALNALLGQYETLCASLDHLSSLLAQSSAPGEQTAALLKRLAEWELAYYDQQAQLAVPEVPTISNAKQPLSLQLTQDFLNSLDGSGGYVEVTRLEPLAGGFGKQTY